MTASRQRLQQPPFQNLPGQFQPQPHARLYASLRVRSLAQPQWLVWHKLSARKTPSKPPRIPSPQLCRILLMRCMILRRIRKAKTALQNVQPRKEAQQLEARERDDARTVYETKHYPPNPINSYIILIIIFIIIN